MRGSWPLVVFAALLAALAVACGGGAPQPTPSPSPPLEPRPTTAPSPASQQVQSEVLAIINGTLIDGTGADPIPDAYVIVQGDRILEVGSGDPQIPPDAAIIDAQSGTILPGLIDAHVHSTRQLINPGDLRVDLDGFLPWLREGITTLRDVGTVPLIFPSILHLVDGLAKNNKAPRIVWSGPIITAVGGYPTTVPDYALVAREVASAEEAAQLVDKLADDGARIIKLGLERGYRSDEGWPLLSLEEVTAISEAAHQRGLLVTAHVTSLDEVRLALDGGVDDLAHAPIEPLSNELMEEMLKRDMTMATTAVIWGPDAGKAADNVRGYGDAGGTVALATDLGCCGQAPGIVGLLQEMEFLVRAGLTPMQVIVTATRGGAIASNLGEELGTIEAGKIADIIVIYDDPLKDLRALAGVVAVIQSGKVVVGETEGGLQGAP